MALPSSGEAGLCAWSIGSLGAVLAATLGCSLTPDASPVPPPPAQPAPWVERFGGEADQASAPAVDAAGDVVVTGSFLGTIDLGAGPLTAAAGGSMFVAKLGAQGQTLWSQAWLPSQEHLGVGHAVVTDGQGNILLAGLTGDTSSRGRAAPAGGFFVAKLDPSGNTVWQTPLLSAYERFNLAVNGGGFAMLSARIPGGLYVEMVDPTGDECWDLSFPIDCVSGMSGIASNANGDLALTGFYDCPVDFGGGPLASDGSSSVFVAAFDATGMFLWSRGVGAQGGTVSGRSLAMDDAGDVFVAGDYTGGPDFGDGALPASSGGLFVAELSPGGNTVWSRGYANATPLGTGALALAGLVGGDPQTPGPAGPVGGDPQTPAGRVVVLGASSGPVDFGGGAPASGGTGAFVLELTAAGAFTAVHGFSASGPSSWLHGGGVAIGASGALAFAGLLSGTVDFGGSTLQSAGLRDVVVGHLVP